MRVSILAIIVDNSCQAYMDNAPSVNDECQNKMEERSNHTKIRR